MKSKWLGMMMVMLGLAAMVSTASAAMIGTYVDANGGSGGNTVNASTGSADDWWTTTNSDTDGLWVERYDSEYGEGDFLEATGTNYENVPTIKTTISGLTPGKSYELRVIYASENETRPGRYTDWVISTGLAADALTTYFWNDGAGNNEPTGVMLAGGAIYQMQVLLGTVVADASGEISAFVDMNNAEGRCRWDGVTYLEVPEPATMGLLTLGGLGMLIRRKR